MPARAPTRRRDPEASRARIMQAATALFCAQGYGATTTAEIASRARVSEGTVFHHFPTKRELLAAVGERAAEALSRAVFREDDLAGPPDVEALIRRLFAYAGENEPLYRVFVMDGDAADLAHGFARKQEGVVRELANRLAHWSARGFLRPMNPAILAELIFAMVDAAARHLYVLGRREDEEECVRELVHCLAGALSPRA